MVNSPLESLKLGKAPLGMRMAIAEGLLPLAGDELVTALSFLVNDKNPKVVRALEENLPDMPRGFLLSTSKLADISPDLLHFFCRILIEDEEIMQAVVLNKMARNETLIHAAENAPVPALEILAQNRNRMLECPPILDTLLKNENLSKVAQYALKEFADRFQISSEGFDFTADAEADVLGEGDYGEDEVVSETATAVEDEIDTAEIPAGLGLEQGVIDALTEGVTGAVIDDDDSMDLDDEDAELLAQVAGNTGVALDEEIESDFSEDIGSLDYESVKGFDSGWDIDALVKEVAGDDMDSALSGDGFDDVLNISVVDDEEDGSADSWIGDDLNDVSDEFNFGDDDDEEDEGKGNDDELVDTRIRLMKMSAADKLIIAKMGTKQERAILVTDPNKKVAIAVVEGPKMSEYEIVRIAANRQVYEEVLRAIAKHREWGRSNAIKRELVLNPKTPLAMTTRMLPSLNEYILKDVVKSKDLPSALVNQAKRVLNVREKRRGS